MKKYSIKSLVGLICLFLLSTTSISISYAQSKIEKSVEKQISIPAGELSNSLRKLSDLFGVSVIAPDALVSGKQNSAIQGKMSLESALKNILSDSGLTVKKSKSGTITLVKAPAKETIENNDNQETVSEIILVYGERVERPIEETLSTISVINEEEAKRKAQQNIYEAIVGIPNTLYTEGDGFPAIRGQQPTAIGASLGAALISGTEPRSVVVIDGFAQPTSWANNSFISLMDVEQVEVFRGPQSTLRGRNASAGMFVIKTQEPSFDFNAKAQAEYTYDEFAKGSYRLGGVLNGALIKDRVAGRLTVETREQNDTVGDFRAVNAGQGPLVYRADGDAENASKIDNSFVRGKLLILPTDSEDLTINLVGAYTEGTTPLFRNNISGPAGGNAFEDRAPAFPSDYRVVDSKAYFFGGTLNYDLGSNGELEVLLSQTHDEYYSNTSRSSSSVVFNDSESEVKTYEALWRFGNNESSWSGLLGASYIERLSAVDALAFTRIQLDISTKVKTKSIYADIRYAFSDRWELNLGGRYLDARQLRSATFFLPFYDNEVVEDKEFLPQFGLSYELNDEQNISLSIRRGFGDSAVAFNGTTFKPYAYDAEYVTTTELSWKGNFGNNKGRFSTVAFYNDYEDQQLSVQVSSEPPFATQVINQPKSRSKGFEFEGTYDFSDTLTASVALGLIDTEITDSIGLNVKDGNEFGVDPSYTLQLGTVWKATDALTVDGRIVSVGEYFTTTQNETGTKAGDYELVDVGVAYDFGKFQARFFVQNLFDELAFTGRFPNNFGATVLTPRTIGLTLNADF